MPQLDTLALLAEHAGIWEGEYTHIDPADRSVQQRLKFRIRVECPAGGGVDYRQTSHYWFEDGTEQELVYEGRMHEGRLAIIDGRLSGAVWRIEDRTLYMRFGFEGGSDEICEMIQLSRDGRHRARTWHWFRDEALWRITLVREQRVTRDPSQWPRFAGTKPGA
jgi:hypothetical protein